MLIYRVRPSLGPLEEEPEPPFDRHNEEVTHAVLCRPVSFTSPISLHYQLSSICDSLDIFLKHQRSRIGLFQLQTGNQSKLKPQHLIVIIVPLDVLIQTLI